VSSAVPRAGAVCGLWAKTGRHRTCASGQRFYAQICLPVVFLSRYTQASLGVDSGMDFKLVATTFVAVFLAELGDKTQLATLSFASGGSSRWAVFLGSAGALVCTSALAVLGGEAVARIVPPLLLKRLSGVAFVVIGVWVLLSARARA
jgi:putative Ca2+/H+ antiporter (TMEM165/GDT1 family)